MARSARAFRQAWTLCGVLLFSLFLSACHGGFSPDTYAEHHGFEGRVAHGAVFDVKWFLRGAGPVLRVYIEGDGKAWLNRRRPSSDPTPDDPTAFGLAVADSSAAVAYVARPCQFTEGDERRNCCSPFWTSARFSEPVVSDISTVLDRAMEAAGAHRLELVGFSGGGAVALLVAARRDDVDLVVTVAGNLDHAFWTAHHHVSPLRDSLNPADFVDRLQEVPQVHIVSSDDDIMPPSVAQSYVGRMADSGRVRVVTVSGVEHTGDWGPILFPVLEGR